MKVLLVGHSGTGGGKEQIIAYKAFLKSKGYAATALFYPSESYSSKLWYLYQNARARLHQRERVVIEKISEQAKRELEKNRYDAVISVGTPFAHVLTKDLNCLKIFSPQTSGNDELYFSKRLSIERIKEYKDLEIEIMEKSDYVIFPCESLQNYVKKHVVDSKNFVIINYGCYPQQKLASYSYPPAIISMGNLSHYWSNKELLSHLTKISPYLIHAYGQYKPEKKYGLRYQGYASSLSVLYNYQFGLNTVSKDPLRRSDHSSRVLTYLAYGLPVLSPDWMEFSNSLKGCLPFNEENFNALIDRYSDRDEWDKLSHEAYNQALELDWNKTLIDLDNLLISNIKK
jgi:hypothetical protein